MLLQRCVVLVMSRKWGCYKAKCTSCVSEVNYYSRESHFLFVLVLISPHSWCVLPSGPPLIKPFSYRKLDYPSPRFLPSLPHRRPHDGSCPIKQQTLSFYMPGCISFMRFPAAVGWVNNVPKLEHFIESGFLPVTWRRQPGEGTELFHVFPADSETQASVLITQLLTFSSFLSNCGLNRDTNTVKFITSMLIMGISTFLHWHKILLLWTFKPQLI